MVIIDTNIIIDYLRRPDKEDSSFLIILKYNVNDITAVSTLSIQELYEGKSTRDHQRERILVTAISRLKIVDYTYEIAQLAGELTRDSIKTLEFVDAGIAASAIMNECKLFTLNTKDFEGIKDLKILRLS